MGLGRGGDGEGGGKVDLVKDLVKDVTCRVSIPVQTEVTLSQFWGQYRPLFVAT